MKNFKQLYLLTIKNILIKHKYISNLSEFKNLVELYKTKKRVAKSQFKELINNNGLSKSDIKDIIQPLNKFNNFQISTSNINKLTSRINQIYTYYALLEYDNWTKCYTTMPEKRNKKKPSTSSFIHEFPLKVSKHSQRKYNIKFNAAKELYNSILGELFKRHKLMLSDIRYQNAIELYKDNSKKEAQTLFDKLNVEYQITKNDLQKLAKDIKNKCYMKDHLDSVSIQKLSDRIFDTYIKWIYKKGGKPRFKSWKNGIRSMEGKSNTCLSFKNNVFSWDGHNDFWGGRISNSDSTYKSLDLSKSIYFNAQIMSSTFMDIYEKLGREITDVLILESMYYNVSESSFFDLADNLLRIDSLLHNGKYKCEIFNVLVNRKVKFGLCIGKTIVKNEGIIPMNTEAFRLGTGNATTIINEENFETVIYIRNQGHSIPEAVNRQMMHYAYHVGQMVYLGRMMKGDDWKSLSIPKGNSKAYNAEKFAQEKGKRHFTDEYLK